MTGHLAVIKLGGHAMDDPDLLEVFSQNVAELSKSGIRFVIVHGGGPQINSLLKKLKIESHFVNGLRVTDAPVLAAVEMALCGAVNKAVTRMLTRKGVRGAGISGQDGGLLTARIKNHDLGLVGEITSVEPAILSSLLEGEFTPVVAPLALSDNYEALNVNADTAAGAIAGSLKADSFVLISDVPGVLDCDQNLIPILPAADIAALIKDGTICGGMIPKVECCQEALAAGCKSAIILDGKKSGNLADFMLLGRGSGTIIQ